MKKSNLKPWSPGVSGNPYGRPKGTRSVKKIILDLLNNPETYKLLPKNTLRDTQTPLEAIICSLMVKSIDGDVRASDVLLKYIVERDEVAEEPYGLFDGRQKTIRFEVVGGGADPDVPDNEVIEEGSSTLKGAAELENLKKESSLEAA